MLKTVLLLVRCCWNTIIINFFKENRDELDVATVTTVGEEPRLVMIVNEDNSTSAVFVMTDGMRTEKASNLCDGSFHLLLLYYISNLNYPDAFAPFVGFIQHECLQDKYPAQLRTIAFKQLR